MIIKSCYLFRSTSPIIGVPNNDADINNFFAQHAAQATQVQSANFDGIVYTETADYTHFSTAVESLPGAWTNVKYINLAHTLDLYVEVSV